MEGLAGFPLAGLAPSGSPNTLSLTAAGAGAGRTLSWRRKLR